MRVFFTLIISSYQNILSSVTTSKINSPSNFETESQK